MERLKDLVFLTKDNCYLCRQVYAQDYICAGCSEKIQLAQRELDEKIDGLEAVYVASFYNRYMKEKIRDFKFNDHSYLYKPFGEILLRTVDGLDLGEIDLIIPVPIYKSRWKERGYNQAELLARYLGKELGIDYRFDLVRKIKNTHPQSSLGMVERKVNLLGAFEGVNLDYARGKRILLVDDVTSTGSTLREVGKLLNTVDNKGIVGLVLASTNI